MIKTKLTPIVTATILGLGISTNAQAAERFIVQVDNPGKGIVKAMTKQLDGVIRVDADGFIAIEVEGQTLESLKGVFNNPHVKLIEEDYIRKPLAIYNDDAGNPMQQQVTPYAIYQSQANQLSFNANAGMKVCVIDSGLDSSNSDFVWNNIDGDNDSGTGNWYEAGGEHGTHVAGTIGAADNSFGVVGMAPGVDMHIIKVFNEDGWGYSSDLAKAAQLCSAAGANIINMSLGGGGANNTEESAFDSFVAAGGLVVAAAGNDGNNTRSYPAGYSSIMMIGANDANNDIADFSQFPSCTTGRGKKVKTDETICVEVTAGGVDTLSTFPAGLAAASSLTADQADVDSSAMENFGSTAGLTYNMGTAESIDMMAENKICVIDRGNISFFDKVKNCEDSGGVGAVIINNEAGMLYGTLGDTNTTSIPAIGAALEDRDTLVNASSMNISVTSSDYGFLSGTSMATPAVAGLSALLWSNHPDCNGEQIRQALKATAEDGGVSGKDEHFGYGIVKIADADAYLTANQCSSGPVDDFALSASGYKSKGSQFVDLNWSGSTAANVDVYRSGQIIATVANSGQFTDALNRKGGGSYTYKVCEASASTCTATVNVTF